jgi:hypothetical protein
MVGRSACQQSAWSDVTSAGDPIESASSADASGPLSVPSRLRTSTNAPSADDAGPIHRLREGTQIVEALGHFRVLGDRVMFHTSDGGRSLGGLPNLNLERIVRTVRDHSEPVLWSVTGTVTEFQGANFILIERALLKSQKTESAATPPDRSAERKAPRPRPETEDRSTSEAQRPGSRPG